MNGASEATLQELLSVNKEMAAAIRGLASQGTPGGGSSGGGSTVERDVRKAGIASRMLGGALDAAGSIVSGTFSVAMNLASAGFRGLKQTGEALMANQKALAQGAIDGSNGLASLTEGLSRLPFGLGLVADVMTYQAKKLEKNLATYQKISDTGALLGGNLNTVRQSAAGMYLSMDEFAGVMKASTPYLLKMGTTADDGAKNLIRFNTTMIKGEVGRGLLNMGYSLEQANNMLGNYAASMGGISQDQMNDQAAMEKSVKAFAEELSLSAALEGKSREEKEKEMKEQAANAARELMLSKMTAEEKQRYIEAENRAGMIGGKAAKDALLSTALGLPPMTKQAQIFAATQGKANEAVNDLYKTSKDGTLSEKQRQDAMDKSAAKGTQAMADSAKKYGNVMNAQIMTGGAYAETMTASAKAAADANVRGLKTEEDRVAAIKKTRADQDKAIKDGTAGAVAQAQGAMKHTGGLMDMLAKALEPLFPVIKWLIKGFGDLLPKIIGIGGTIVEVLTGAFKEIFAGISLSDIIKPFKDFWNGLTGGMKMEGINPTRIKDAIVGVVKPLVDAFGSLMSSIDFEAFGSMIRKSVGAIFDMAKSMFNTLEEAGVVEDLTNLFKGFFDGISYLFNVVSTAIGAVDWKGIGDGLANVFKIVWSNIKEVLQPVFEKGSMLFKKIGEDIGPVFQDFSDIFKALLGHITTIYEWIGANIIPIVKPVIDGVMNALFPMWEAFKNVISAVKFLLQGDFTKMGEKLKDAFGNLVDAVKEFISGLWDGVKKILSPSRWFESSDKKPEAPKPAQAQQTATPTQTAQANTQAAIDKLANDWAYSVYTNKATLAQVPKDALAKVQDILKNPPSAWKTASSTTQQSQQSTQTSTEKPVDKPVEKPAATPVADLNNKDALQVLKTIADYQRRTIDALNGLNGNLLKRA